MPLLACRRWLFRPVLLQETRASQLSFNLLLLWQWHHLVVGHCILIIMMLKLAQQLTLNRIHGRSSSILLLINVTGILRVGHLKILLHHHSALRCLSYVSLRRALTRLQVRRLRMEPVVASLLILDHVLDTLVLWNLRSWRYLTLIRGASFRWHLPLRLLLRHQLSLHGQRALHLLLLLLLLGHAELVHSLLGIPFEWILAAMSLIRHARLLFERWPERHALLLIIWHGSAIISSIWIIVCDGVLVEYRWRIQPYWTVLLSRVFEGNIVSRLLFKFVQWRRAILANLFVALWRGHCLLLSSCLHVLKQVCFLLFFENVINCNIRDKRRSCLYSFLIDLFFKSWLIPLILK